MSLPTALTCIAIGGVLGAVAGLALIALGVVP